MDPFAIILIAYAIGALASIRPLGRRRLAKDGNRDVTAGAILILTALVWPLVVLPLLAIRSVPKTDLELKEEARRREIAARERDREIARMEREIADPDRQERIDDPRLAFKRAIERIAQEGSTVAPEVRLRRARDYLTRRGLNPDDFAAEMQELRVALYTQAETQRIQGEYRRAAERMGLDKPPPRPPRRWRP